MGWRHARTIILWAVVLVGAAAQISASDAISNLGSWWRLISPRDTYPSWLTPAFDAWVLWGCLVVLILVLIGPHLMAWWRNRATSRDYFDLMIEIDKLQDRMDAIAGDPLTSEPDKWRITEELQQQIDKLNGRISRLRIIQGD